MTRQKILNVAVIAVTVMALLAVNLPTAFAGPVKNDDFDKAKLITVSPYNDSVDTRKATKASDDPPAYCGGGEATVWYAYTPDQNQSVNINTFGSSYTTVVYIYTGVRGSLSQVTCGYSQSSFVATASQTYYIMVSAASSGYPGPTGAGGDLVFSFTAGPLPSPVASFYFYPSNPSPFVAVQFYGYYSYDPAGLGIQTYDWNLGDGATATDCCPAHQYAADGDYTVQLTVTTVDGRTASTSQVVQVTTQPPVASFYFYPSDPSAFDTLQFYDNSYDPGYAGIQSRNWSFGDGTTATDCCPTHRYAADGDYTVQLTVTTFDGRTASTSQVVHVKTHDVAITKFTVPTSASAGQTRSIVVGVRNTRYPETVRVELYKSTPGGYQSVGFLEQSVPVRSANRTTDFTFNYTFTSDDATIGKVTFRAVAIVINARDALPADNEAISAPTKVTR